MMVYCAEPSCRNGSGRRNNQASGTKYHKFPADEVMARRWWQVIKRGEPFPKNFRQYCLCSSHFVTSDYERDLRSELLKLSPQYSAMKLLPTSVPSRNLTRPPRVTTPRSGAATQRGGEEDESRQVQEEGEQAAPKGSSLQAEECLHSDASVQTKCEPSKCTRCPALEAELASLKSKLAELYQLQAPSSALKRHLFTDQQAENLFTGKAPYRWDDESVYKALEVRVNTSRVQYEWLRNHCLPLPSLSTLQRWLADFVLAPNSSDVQVRMLRRLLSSMSEQDRCCCIMMDEMDIMGVATYDNQLDQILGPHKHLQLFLVSGIFTTWKLPMLYAFDTPVTKELLLKLIKDVEGAGGRVVSTVSDMGSGNLALWRSLGIGHDAEASICNPADPSRRIWVFADPPHIMKRLRNHILDSVIHTRQGGRVDRALIQDLLAIDGDSELKLLHKLQPATHVEVVGMARQKVRPAYQLLSASCALALRRYTEKKVEADFFSIVDAGMDVLNAGHPADVKLLRRGYSGRPEQEDALTALVEEVAAFRVGKAGFLYPFQKGLLVTVRAVRGLLADLQARFGDNTYLLTRHLTQDRLESFFGLVRGRGGGNLNPTPTEAKARLRLLTLLQLTRHGVSPKCTGDGGETDAVPDVSQPEPDAVPAAQPELDEEPPPPPQLLELEEVCPAPTEEIPEGTEHLVQEPDDEPSPDAEEEAERELLDAELGEACHDTGEPEQEMEPREQTSELVSLLAEAGSVHIPGQPSGARDCETGVLASDSALAHVAGYVARKRPRSLGAPSAHAEDVPVQALWTRLRSVGGMTVPTESFLELCRELETCFCAYHAMHPDGLSRERGVIRNATRMMVEKYSRSVPCDKILKVFVRVRTFIRLRTVNSTRRAETLAKRKVRKLRHHAQ
ncbi:Transposable element P transposase [Amphibalanus amphitrite]|uniref:Transposable element P transposase n=1 Tax=Amphibalanus amphitrite TaxID=1232801 RepID=A0A6A4WM23_AMPAM|nr:Transposable element P transposase [Amphibalanus amphitrite]KAF0306300.1 Transposable element P transposase [Amphibalanus amphitrite]